MDYQATIAEHFTGAPEDRQRRAALLSGVLTALERGGADHAAGVLLQPFTEVEQAFATTLTELQRLL